MKKIVRCATLVLVICAIIWVYRYVADAKQRGEDIKTGVPQLDEIINNGIDLDLQTGSATDNRNALFNQDFKIYSGDIKKTKIDSKIPKNLNIKLSGVQMTISEDETDGIYLEATNAGKLQVYVEEDTLYVKGLRTSNGTASLKKSVVVLHIPPIDFEEGNIEVGAGYVEAERVGAKKLTLIVGAGGINIKKFTGDVLLANVGAGEFKLLQGEFKQLCAQLGGGNMTIKNTKISKGEFSCSFGNMNVELVGDEKDFNIDANCIAGNIEVMGKKVASGAAESQKIDQGSNQDLKIDCNMGNINLKFLQKEETQVDAQ